MRRMLLLLPLLLGPVSAIAQEAAGGVAPSTVGRVGQRQTALTTSTSTVSNSRIPSRIETRIETRLRTRIRSGYDRQESATSQVEAAANQARIIRR